MIDNYKHDFINEANLRFQQIRIEHPLVRSGTVPGIADTFEKIDRLAAEYYGYYNSRVAEINNTAMAEEEKSKILGELETLADTLFEQHVPANLVALRGAVKRGNGQPKAS